MLLTANVSVSKRKSEKMDKDIQQGIRTFDATQQALQTIIDNWEKHWSYGSSGGDVQNSMVQTAAGFYNKAKDMQHHLNSMMLEWEHPSNQPAQVQAKQIRKCSKCGETFAIELDNETLCGMCYFMTTGMNKSERKVFDALT